MSRAVELLWPGGTPDGDFAARVAALRAVSRPAAAGTAARLAALNDLSDSVLQGDAGLRAALPADGLAFLSAFLRSDNLRHMIARELPDPAALDQFVPVGARKGLRVLPRGLVCHWVAGNVPLLAVFSWALSAALGNANVMRLSSRQGDSMSPLLRALAARSAAGKLIADETLVVTFDRAEEGAQRAMSIAADVRVAWGGEEAVTAIRDLPRRWDCEDVVFGPRMSMSVIDPGVIKPAAVGRLATDVVIFDQMACSSPQFLFVKGKPGQPAFDGFVTAFAEAMGRQSRAFPRHFLGFSETYRIVLDRSRAILRGGSMVRDSRTEWTVAVLDEPVEGINCTNRFVQLVPYESLEAVCAFIPENVQTCVTQLAAGEFAEFTEKAAWRGVCRFPGPGEGNHFENPWDGLGLVSRLTRAVVRSEPAR